MAESRGLRNLLRNNYEGLSLKTVIAKLNQGATEKKLQLNKEEVIFGQSWISELNNIFM